MWLYERASETRAHRRDAVPCVVAMTVAAIGIAIAVTDATLYHTRCLASPPSTTTPNLARTAYVTSKDNVHAQQQQKKDEGRGASPELLGIVHSRPLLFWLAGMYVLPLCCHRQCFVDERGTVAP